MVKNVIVYTLNERYDDSSWTVADLGFEKGWFHRDMGAQSVPENFGATPTFGRVCAKHAASQ